MHSVNSPASLPLKTPCTTVTFLTTKMRRSDIALQAQRSMETRFLKGFPNTSYQMIDWEFRIFLQHIESNLHSKFLQISLHPPKNKKHRYHWLDKAFTPDKICADSGLPSVLLPDPSAIPHFPPGMTGIPWSSHLVSWPWHQQLGSIQADPKSGWWGGSKSHGAMENPHAFLVNMVNTIKMLDFPLPRVSLPECSIL